MPNCKVLTTHNKHYFNMKVRFKNKLKVLKYFSTSGLYLHDTNFFEIEILPRVLFTYWKTFTTDYESWSYDIILSWLVFEIKIEIIDKYESYKSRPKRIDMRIRLLKKLSNEIVTLIEEERNEKVAK